MSGISALIFWSCLPRSPVVHSLSDPSVSEVQETEDDSAPPPIRWQSLGLSWEGRPILVTTQGSGPYKVYLIAGIHGDEGVGRALAWELAYFLAWETPASLQVRMVQDMNPDGTAAERRGNSRGVDLNRNWPASNFRAHTRRGPVPLSEVETRLVYEDMLAYSPDLVISLHASRRDAFVNHDGPDGARLADVFLEGVKRQDPRWSSWSSIGYPTPGSLGSLVGEDWKKPALTLEFQQNDQKTIAREVLHEGLRSLFKDLEPSPPVESPEEEA